MRDESKERSELLLAIQDLGYESLRYSIFNDHSPREWETRIEYSSPLWDKSMMDIENMKYIVEQEIKKRHFESLHYVLFDENKRLPWAFHLYQKNGKFYVDGRDDRSYIVGHSKEYDDFESAKEDFFEKLELVIESNKLNIQLGLSPEYPSPLWDEKEEH